MFLSGFYRVKKKKKIKKLLQRFLKFFDFNFWSSFETFLLFVEVFVSNAISVDKTRKKKTQSVYGLTGICWWSSCPVYRFWTTSPRSDGHLSRCTATWPRPPLLWKLFSKSKKTAGKLQWNDNVVNKLV